MTAFIVIYYCTVVLGFLQRTFVHYWSFSPYFFSAFAAYSVVPEHGIYVIDLLFGL